MNTFPGQSLTGTRSFGSLGSDISSAGDVNGDGFDDYIVGSTREITTQNGINSAGAAFVVYGSADGPSALGTDDIDGTNGFRINSNGASSSGSGNGNFAQLGTHVTGLGDVNGDGIDDILVAGDTYNGYGSTAASNFAYVLFGSTSGFAADISVASLNGTNGFAIDGIDGYLTTVGGADINNDGINDIVIGQNPVPEVMGGYGGYYGPQFLVASGPGTDEAAGDPAAGGYVLFGSAGIGATGTADAGSLDGTNGFVIQSEVGTVSSGFEGPFIYDNQIGGGLFTVGDLNGDGFDDIFVQNVIGEPAPGGLVGPGSTVFRTEQYIVFGAANGFTPVVEPDTAPGVLAVDYPAANFSYGGQNNDIAGIGDINGDGFDEIAISTRTIQGSEVQVLYGSATGPVATLTASGPAIGDGFTISNSDLNAFNDDFGRSVSAAGDVNNDGFDDFLIGVPGADETNGDAGSTFLILGNAGGFANDLDLAALTPAEFDQTAYRFDGVGINDESGSVVAAAGDLNNDGFDDIMISAPDASSAASSNNLVGETYVIYGGAALEAFDNADGTDDNIISLSNIDADISTGEVPTEVSIISQGLTRGLETDIGTTPITFTLQRDGDASRAVSVDYAVTGSGFFAADAADFGGALPSGTVTFAAGSLTADLTVNVTGDDDIEPSEDFRVTLSNPVGAGPADTTLGNAVAFGRIDTDDVPPRIFVTGGNSIVEGDTGDTTAITFTINRVGDASVDATVSYDLAGTSGNALLSADSDDIVGTLPSSGMVTLLAGETSATVTVQVTGDDIVEARESLVLSVTDVVSSGVTYAVSPASRTATIFNDDGRPVVIPDGVESDVFGDPHLITLDGLAYDFQAVGEYILVETTATGPGSFQVQARFEPVGGSQVASQTTAMAVQIAGRTVEVIAGGEPALRIDGVPTDIDPQGTTPDLDFDGDGTPNIFFDGVDYTIVLNAEGEQLKVGNFGTFLNVCTFLSDGPNGNAGAVRGLMGNGDGDLSNDFTLRDGSPIPPAAVTTEIDDDGNSIPRLDFDFLYGRNAYSEAGYAQSWALDGNGADRTAFFTGDAVTFPTGFPAGVISIDDLPAEIRAQAEQAALDAGLDPAAMGDAIFEAAVLDFALTGNPDYLTGAAGLAATPAADSDPTNTGPALDALGILPSASTVIEGDGGTATVIFTVYRTGDTTGTLTADYTIGGDIDAADLAAGQSLNGTVSFAAGEGTANVAIEVAGDIANEADEALTFSVSNLSDTGVLVANDSVSVTVVNDDVNNAPIIANALADAASAEEAPVSITLPANAFSDIDGDILTLTATLADGTALPAWLVFDAAAGTFTGTPPLDFTGALDIEVTADDGALTASDTFTLTITPVNDAPTVANPLADQSFEEDTPIAFTLAADAFADVDGDALTLDATLVDGTALPAWLTFDADTGTFSGTPPLDFTGTLSIEVTADDGLLNVSDAFDLEITPAPVDPFADFERGTEGRDFLFGTLFAVNKIFGAGGDDYILGGFLDDELAGGTGIDWLYGLYGDDILQGNEGNDRLVGWFGDDMLSGDAGNDRLYGGADHDTLDGGAGHDRLFGGWGDDELTGGTGNDRLTGGVGADVFVFSEGDGRDRIEDFSFSYTFPGGAQPGDTIRIDVDGIDSLGDLIGTGIQRGNHVTFDFGDGDRLTVRDTRLTWFNADDFDFV